eukprot:scaffold19815_cov58-Attheya_sp.AAC.4
MAALRSLRSRKLRSTSNNFFRSAYFRPCSPTSYELLFDPTSHRDTIIPKTSEPEARKESRVTDARIITKREPLHYE